jgi:fermentation-respiration switch protein FrsA (DUF1100 family)
MLESLVNRYIYYPEPHWAVAPERFGLEAEDVYLSPEPGVQLHAWFFPQPQPPVVSVASLTAEPPVVSVASLTAEPPVVSAVEPLATLLFCHGNAGNISHRLENVAHLLRTGFQVLLFDYRGYGHSSGQPSEQGLYRDAAAAWAHLVERTDTAGVPRVIFGRSLGGAVAVDLATCVGPDTVGASAVEPDAVKADGLIIESTFTSVQALTRLIFPVPLPTLPVKYDSLSKIRRLKTSLLVIHGERDELIPVAEGRALFEAAPEPKAWYPISGAGHNDTYLVGGEAYFRQLATFAGDLPGGQT